MLACATAFGALPAAAPAATIAVTTTADAVADDGLCSLRGAFNSANGPTADRNHGCTPGDPLVPGGADGADTIVLPAGTYALTGAAGDDANVSGDLDVTSDATVDGAGSALTIIDAAGLDRAFDVQSDASLSSVDVAIEELTIRNGNAAGVGAAGDGGGARMLDSNGSLALRGAIVESSDATRWGGAMSFASPISGQGAIRCRSSTADCATTPPTTTARSTGASSATTPATGCSSTAARWRRTAPTPRAA